MAFPINPTNGQQTTENGIVYTYNSTLGVWAVGTNAGAAISANTLAVSNSATVGTTLVVAGNVSGGNLTTGGLISAAGNVSGGNLTTGGLISATGNVSGGNILSNAAISASGTINSVGIVQRNTAGGVPSTTARFGLTTSSKLDMHINTSVNGTAPSNYQQYGMSFSNGNGQTQAAIVCSENQNDGTAIGLFTTGSYAAGPQWRAMFDPSGHFSPAANNTYDLGTSSLRWRNIYTNDLQLSNGIGDYTVVEGEEDLFLYNNKSGKTFKFALIEVDPSTVPPKAQTGSV